MKEQAFSSQTDFHRETIGQSIPRAAVVRPQRGIVGITHPEDVEQEAHRSTPQNQQLNEYVRWLQKQSVEDLNQIDRQPEPLSRTSTHPQMERQKITPEQSVENAQKLDRDRWTFIHPQTSDLVLGSKSQLGFQPSADQAKPQTPSTPASRPILELVSSDQADRSERPKFRVDPPNVQLGGNRAPAPNLPATEYQVDADLLRILRKLDSVEQTGKRSESRSSRPDSGYAWQDRDPASSDSVHRQTPRQTPPQTPAVAPAETQKKPVIFSSSSHESTLDFSPIESSVGARRVAPLEFQRNSEIGWNSMIDRQMSQSISEAPAADQLSKREIIETVSRAIASVLTDQNEGLIEKKVRERLDQLQREWLPQNHFAQPQTSSQTVPDTSLGPATTGWEFETGFHSSAAGSFASTVQSAVQSAVEPVPHSKQNNADEISQARSPEKPEGIPVEVAAWDVNDFRWPTISTQMITVGGQAIDALYRSLLNNPQPASRRGPTRRIGISSPNRQAGTTSIAISLARWAVDEGCRVLLIDADLQNPALSSETGLGSSISWGRLQAEKPLNLSTVAESIIRSQQSQLCVMPLGTDGVAGNSGRFPLDFLASLVDRVAEHFDLILIDAGPADQILKQISQPGLLLDSVLLVHQHRNLQLDEIQNQFRKRGIQKLVLAQNAAQSGAASQVA